MGSIIDTENVENIYRCNRVKYAIIFINLIGAPLSLIFLLIGIFRMIYKKKKLSYLTNLILLIFFSEIVNTISKILQLLKYIFEDERGNKEESVSIDNARGIICQIQIVTAMFSDFCSLFTTLLLSLRCYDVIKHKKRFFDKGNNAILSIIIVILLSIILSIGFLFYDRKLTTVFYRYDVRDRCSYWCWLGHKPSIICFIFYWIILIFNIIFSCKTNCYLKKGYNKLIEENKIISEKNDNMNTPLNEIVKDNNNSKNDSSDFIKQKKNNNISTEEKKRIDELYLMRIKCLIYPSVTIIIWLFIATYRIVDDVLMYDFDEKHYATPGKGREKEQDFFNEHSFIQFLVQFFLVIHTILSSFRGIFYGISFIVFEENIFNNFFRKILNKIKKKDDSDIKDENNIVKNSNNTSSVSDYNEIKNKEENEDNEKQEENISKTDTIEMNTSDCHFNEND